MKNDEFNNLNDKELLRLTGIKQAIFNVGSKKKSWGFIKNINKVIKYKLN